VAAYLPPGKGLRLTLTSNRTTCGGATRAGGLRVRVHQYLPAPSLVWCGRCALRGPQRPAAHPESWGSFMRASPKDLIQFRHRAAAPGGNWRPAGRSTTCRTFDRLNRRYFEGKKLQAQITWGAGLPAAPTIHQDGQFLGETPHHATAWTSPRGSRRGTALFRHWIVFHGNASRPENEIRPGKAGADAASIRPEFLAHRTRILPTTSWPCLGKENVDRLFGG